MEDVGVATELISKLMPITLCMWNVVMISNIDGDSVHIYMYIILFLFAVCI